jgi:hypothetical protein
MIFFGETNIAALDLPWSIVHGISGLAIGLGLRFARHSSVRRVRFGIGVATLTIWEVFEYGLGVRGWVELESWINILSDILVGSVGVWLTLFWVYRGRRHTP